MSPCLDVLHRSRTLFACSVPVLVLVLVLVAGCRSQVARPLRVAAAADLQAAFADVEATFAARTGHAVSISYGSSGLLMRQIAQGAPYDLFAAASAGYIDALIREGRVTPASRARYARGQLCLWTPQDGPVLGTLGDLLRPEVHRVAIANPDHAPYGQAAAQALRASGAYDALRPRLVYGENVRQALQFAETGHAEAALVACSLLTPGVGHRVEIPAALSGPVDQYLGVVRGGDEAGAEALRDFLLSPEGRRILLRHGFVVPDPARETEAMISR